MRPKKIFFWGWGACLRFLGPHALQISDNLVSVSVFAHVSRLHEKEKINKIKREDW